jgi:hypothetical protein
MQRPSNDDPIVRSGDFVNIESGILKCAGNLPMVAPWALNSPAGRLVTVNRHSLFR